MPLPVFPTHIGLNSHPLCYGTDPSYHKSAPLSSLSLHGWRLGPVRRCSEPAAIQASPAVRWGPISPPTETTHRQHWLLTEAAAEPEREPAMHTGAAAPNAVEADAVAAEAAAVSVEGQGIAEMPEAAAEPEREPEEGFHGEDEENVLEEEDVDEEGADEDDEPEDEEACGYDERVDRAGLRKELILFTEQQQVRAPLHTTRPRLIAPSPPRPHHNQCYSQPIPTQVSMLQKSSCILTVDRKLAEKILSLDSTLVASHEVPSMLPSFAKNMNGIRWYLRVADYATLGSCIVGSVTLMVVDSTEGSDDHLLRTSDPYAYPYPIVVAIKIDCDGRPCISAESREEWQDLQRASEGRGQRAIRAQAHIPCVLPAGFGSSSDADCDSDGSEGSFLESSSNDTGYHERLCEGTLRMWWSMAADAAPAAASSQGGIAERIMGSDGDVDSICGGNKYQAAPAASLNRLRRPSEPNGSDDGNAHKAAPATLKRRRRIALKRRRRSDAGDSSDDDNAHQAGDSSDDDNAHQAAPAAAPKRPRPSLGSAAMSMPRHPSEPDSSDDDNAPS